MSNQDQPSPEENAPGPAGQGAGDQPQPGYPSGGQPPPGQYPGGQPSGGQPPQPGYPPPGYGPQGPQQGPPQGPPPGYGSGQQPPFQQPGAADYGAPQPFGNQQQPFGSQPQPYGSQPQPGYDPNAYGGDPNSFGGSYGGGDQGYTPVTFEQPLGAPGVQPPPGYGGPGGYNTGAGQGFGPTGPAYPAQSATGGGNKGLFIGLGVGGVALIIAIVALVVIFVNKGGSGPTPSPGPTQAGPTASSTGGTVTPASTGNPNLPGEPKPSIFEGYNSTTNTFSKINERSNDSKPLTLDEVFTGDGAAPAYEGKNIRFKLTNQDLTTDCGSLVWGDKLKADLKAAGCTQAVRGAYVSTDGKAVAIGVAFNLKSNTDAGRVIDTMDPEKGAGGWVLTPKTGNAVEKLGKGYTWGKGDGLGHFLCVTATQRTDGASPALGSDDLIPYSVAMSDFEEFVYQRNIN